MLSIRRSYIASSTSGQARSSAASLFVKAARRQLCRSRNCVTWLRSPASEISLRSTGVALLDPGLEELDRALDVAEKLALPVRVQQSKIQTVLPQRSARAIA